MGVANTARRNVRAGTRDRFGLLLLLLVGSFLALGVSGDRWGRVVAGVLQLGALAVAFLATEVRVDHRWLGLLALCGITAVVLAALSGEIPNGLAEVAAVIVLGAVLVAVLDRVLRHRRVTLQTLYGAMCAYILIGLMFGSVYRALDELADASLFGEPVDVSVYSYFSFTTLTTLGFGDYTTVTDIGRRLTMLEAVMGQLFIATTLARLVSVYSTQAAQDRSP
ncbi:MAG TPA: potassium channel family protein [Acidimicrobiales bacterium]|jgi:hypothetical protein|nr:potassium channel family protein [Acidimicrobiales bacterium]